MLRIACYLSALALLSFPLSSVALAVSGPKSGQELIDRGQLTKAYLFYSRLIEEEPSEIDGYRGRIETLVLMQRYSDALSDYSQIIANVLPVNPTAIDDMLNGYHARLMVAPQSIPALSGGSFVHWCSFDYETAANWIERLIQLRPKSAYGRLLRGSIRLLSGSDVAGGMIDLEAAILADRRNPHVRFIVADAYTYGYPEPCRAFYEAYLAIAWGLDTPRMRAILAAAYFAFGSSIDAAEQLERHIEMVTQEVVTTTPLGEGTLVLDLIPGRTFAIPINATAGQSISLITDSPSGDITDTIMVLLSPDGQPISGNDDDEDFYAALDYVFPAVGTYTLMVTSFEAIGTGQITVSQFPGS